MQPSGRRWLMISFAFWATVINYLDRQTLSVAAPVLRDQFHMSNVAYSGVVFAFLLAYTVSNGISGPVVGRRSLARLGNGRPQSRGVPVFTGRRRGRQLAGRSQSGNGVVS